MEEETRYTKQDLETMRAWTLQRKIQVTQTRLIEWLGRYDWNVYVSFSGGKDSIVFGYVAFARNGKKDVADEAKSDATVLTEIGYIKANTDEIKAEQKEQRKTNVEVVTRLTAVEASAKQAHKRLDTFENRERHEHEE